MMPMLVGVCAAVFVCSTAVFSVCCMVAARARDTNQIGSIAYGIIALPVAGVSGVLLVILLERLI